jgi:hypothetical protein
MVADHFTQQFIFYDLLLQVLNSECQWTNISGYKYAHQKVQEVAVDTSMFI